METKGGEPATNFREITPTPIQTVFLPVAVWTPQEDHQRLSNCKPRDSIRMPPSVLQLKMLSA